MVAPGQALCLNYNLHCVEKYHKIYFLFALTPWFILSHRLSAPLSKALSKNTAPTNMVTTNVEVLLKKML